MSINASIKSSKTMDQSNARLTSMVSNSSRMRRENIIKKRRGNVSFLDSLEKNYSQHITKEDVDEHVRRIADESINPADLVSDVTFFRRLLSNDHYPPIDLVIQTGLIPRFVSFLKYDSCPQLQYEAAWVLTNIASGTKEQTATVVECGALPDLIRLLESPDSGVREQASWALGNIAGDSYQYRDAIINVNGVELILRQLQSSDCTELFQKNCVWLLSNLCRMRDGVQTDFERVKICLPYMEQCLSHESDDIVTDACWCFAFITDCNKSNTKYMLEMGVLPKVMSLLGSPSIKVITPALRTIGNVLAGDDAQTQQCIDLNVMQYLCNLLTSTNLAIVKESAWCLSNITAGTYEQIQTVINHGVIPVLVELIRSNRSDIQKEACWAICNAFCGGNPQQIYLLATMDDVVPSICSLLVDDSGSKLISIIIDSLDRILSLEDMMINSGNIQTSRFKPLLDDCGCLDNIENLTMLDDSATAKIRDFIDRHFGYDDDDIDFSELH